MNRFAPALAVANAVLYEGYLLYPYTKSSEKNRVRWQFGVVAPRAYAAGGTGETAEQQTEILVETASAEPRISVLLRFLHVEARRVEELVDGAYVPVESLTVGSQRYLTFDEAVEREIPVEVNAGASDLTLDVAISIDGGTTEELLHDANGAVRGRIVREQWPLRGTVALRCVAVPGAPALRKLTVRVENDSEVVAGERAGALRTAFVSTHVLLAAENARFVSVLDPTPEATEATKTLKNRHVFPVLVGDQSADEQRASLALASPIILYDFPAVAAQTDADAFDATEIDELLTLSVLSLPDAEREEARATDPRARAIVERAERFTPHDLARVHAGALHRVGAPPPGAPPDPFTRNDPFALTDPFAAIDVPALDCVFVDGIKVAKGSSVRLQPKRRADVWDAFLVGKTATVRAIHQDVEDVLYVAVTVDDDPASDLHEWYGRSLFFYPDEIEPLEGAS
ncbi:MAG TPA: hypothetical protein VGX96_00540 [Candidatus Elarobacter sp.]|jgi:hypothetical protein|nr:hypothetical protein [Candidatus Elarobacter sp.]